MLDRELLFQMLMDKKWEGLAEQLYMHRSLLNQDPVLQQVAGLFNTEFVSYLRAQTPAEQVKATRHIAMLFVLRRADFKETFWRPVMEIKLQAMYDIQDLGLAGVASEWSHVIPLAQVLLERLQQERPEELADARRSALNIKAANPAKKPQSLQQVTSIFKCPQERRFYLAMLDVVPSLLPFPNLAVSVALDFQAIAPKVSTKAKDYFFQAQFDCVVIDPAQDYRPVHFFELDSTYHDTVEAIKRDQLKNEICAAAGIKMLRVRAFEKNETTQESFAQLIREVLAPALTKRPDQSIASEHTWKTKAIL